MSAGLLILVLATLCNDEGVFSACGGRHRSNVPGTPVAAVRWAVVVWLTEGTWAAWVDATRLFAPTKDVALRHVTGDDVAQAAHAAYRGLLGHGHPERDPGARLEELAAQVAAGVLDAAAARIGRPVTRIERHGRVEREVVRAAALSIRRAARAVLKNST